MSQASLCLRSLRQHRTAPPTRIPVLVMYDVCGQPEKRCAAAVQGPVRDAVAVHGAAVASIAESDLRPINLRDFQVGKTRLQPDSSSVQWPHIHVTSWDPKESQVGVPAELQQSGCAAAWHA